MAVLHRFYCSVDPQMKCTVCCISSGSSLLAKVLVLGVSGILRVKHLLNIFCDIFLNFLPKKAKHFVSITHNAHEMSVLISPSFI